MTSTRLIARDPDATLDGQPDGISREDTTTTTEHFTTEDDAQMAAAIVAHFSRALAEACVARPDLLTGWPAGRYGLLFTAEGLAITVRGDL